MVAVYTPGAGGGEGIVGSDGTIWTISNAQVAVNGVIDQTTNNVIELAYVNGQVWRESSATILSTSTYCTPGVGSITWNGNVYSIDTNLNMDENGQAINGGSNTGQLDLYNNIIYAVDASTGNWFTWNGTTFAGPLAAPGNLPAGVLWYYKTIPSNTWQPTSGTTVNPLGVLAPPPSPPPSGPAVTFNLASPTGVVIPKTFYGVACNAMSKTDVYNYDLMADTAFQPVCKSMNFGSVRLNWTMNSQMTLIFPSRGASPNWSYVDNFINYAQECFTIGTTQATANLIITVGWCSWLNITSSSDWAVHQGLCQQVAQHFLNGGLPCYYWTFANEADGTDINSCIGLFNAMKAGVKAVNSQYYAGGLDDSYANQSRLTTFIQQCAPDFISWHGYTEEEGSDSVAQCFANELTDNFEDVRAYSQTAGLSGTSPMMLTEFNMDGTPNYSSYQEGITGAVYAAFRYATVGPAGTMWSLNRWDVAYDAYYGLIQSNTFGQGPYYLIPSGYVYTKLSKITPGNVVTSAVTGGSMNIVTMGTVNGSNFTCQIINYDVSTNYTVSVVMNGSTATAWTYWELSAANPSGFTTSLSTTSMLAGITIPAMSVVVLSIP